MVWGDANCGRRVRLGVGWVLMTIDLVPEGQGYMTDTQSP